MFKITIARAFSLIFGGLIAILILIGGLASERLRTERMARHWLQHSNRVLALIQDLNVGMHAIEAGQRGYLLTGEDAYLQPYDAAVARISDLRRQLIEETSDNAGHRERLLAFGPTLQSKLEELAAAVRVRRDGNIEAALQILRADVGRGQAAQIAGFVAAMAQAEEVLLQQRLDATDNRGFLTLAWVATGTGIAILTLLWAARMLYLAAATDALTGLQSRNRMWEIFTAWQNEAPPRMAAMLYVDIDRFRSVNQVFGPAAGDKLIKEMGRRLLTIAGRHHVGRLGGDDFAICCLGTTPDEAAELGIAAAAILAMPFTVRHERLHLTASVGVAHSDTAGAVDLRQGADDARYVAKLRGGNQAVAFVPAMHASRKAQAELEQEMHLALEQDGQLSMAYQPVVRMSDCSLVAVEALARWTHPRLGAIPPDRFIELAESRGMMIPLGQKLMRIALAQAAAWHARYPGVCPVMNINISPVQLAGGQVIDELVELVRDHDLSPGAFCIEVTESAFTEAQAVCALEKARRLGFRVSLDDFGIGFSALSQLPRLPLAAIKLDRSFTSHAAESLGDAAILAAIVHLAHALKLTVVAEGVETAAQLALVADCGCDAVQGYYFSRPLSPEGLEAWLAAEATRRTQHPLLPAA
ncbi:diguanylate cyclase (GGDEF)-like protein [Humitalea rosea]|uniref:Diguanylate cyclase (GGDEF)-like protein n=1 Tax=Humitalea rosea TaxID=990373 RepID=A0A2W7IU50_9PROT|nr:EAL domain-containing protein [Humitalea rosea]PZW42203.1 diguanylate cyclase (GGDEF)-like protein [Humitalea rosea]